MVKDITWEIYLIVRRHLSILQIQIKNTIIPKQISLSCPYVIGSDLIIRYFVFRIQRFVLKQATHVWGLRPKELRRGTDRTILSYPSVPQVADDAFFNFSQTFQIHFTRTFPYTYVCCRWDLSKREKHIKLSIDWCIFHYAG